MAQYSNLMTKYLGINQSGTRKDVSDFEVTYGIMERMNEMVKLARQYEGLHRGWFAFSTGVDLG